MPEIIDCEQGTEAWYLARAGIPTASEYHTVMAKGRGGDDSKTRRTYMLKLAGEVLTGVPMEGYSNAHMERGHAMEEEARAAYQFETGSDPQLVGFIKSGDTGASPDSLVGSNGLLEIKTKLPHLLLDCLLKDIFPPEHKAQCQGALWVSEREWIDIAVYWPGLPMFIKRAHRDEEYIAQIASSVAQFNDELAEIVARVRSYGMRAAA